MMPDKNNQLPEWFMDLRPGDKVFVVLLDHYDTYNEDEIIDSGEFIVESSASNPDEANTFSVEASPMDWFKEEFIFLKSFQVVSSCEHDETIIISKEKEGVNNMIDSLVSEIKEAAVEKAIRFINRKA